MGFEYLQKLEKQLEEVIDTLLELTIFKDESEKESDLDIHLELKLK